MDVPTRTYGLTCNLSISQGKVSRYFSDFLDDVWKNQWYEVNGVKVKLERNGKVDVQIHQGFISCDMPLDIQLKRPSGLFTVEGEGSLVLKTKTGIEFGSGGQVKSRTEIVEHAWTEKPVVTVGILNMPVETLINLLLDHHESLITSRVDEIVQTQVNLKGLVDNHLLKPIENIDIPSLGSRYVDLKIKNVDIDLSKSTANHVLGQVYIDYDIDLAGKGKEVLSDNEMIVNWVQPKSVTVSKTLDAFFTYDELESVIHEWISKIEISNKPVELEELQLSFPDKFKVNGIIASPVSASFSVEGFPRYEKEEGTLYLDHMSTSFNPSNIFQKALSFIIKGKIQSTIEKKLPLKINEQLYALKEKIPSYSNDEFTASIHMDRLSCHDIYWKTEGLKVGVVLDNLSIRVEEDEVQPLA